MPDTPDGKLFWNFFLVVVEFTSREKRARYPTRAVRVHLFYRHDRCRPSSVVGEDDHDGAVVVIIFAMANTADGAITTTINIITTAGKSSLPCPLPHPQF